MLPAHAQFNTVAKISDRCRIEVVREDTTGATPAAKAADDDPCMQKVDTLSVSSADISRKTWTERYLSVCYPLRRMKINSPYGYREDPFTGKRRFHGGIDLQARGDEALAMMDGVVVKVGQDKSSGKYVTLRHGNYTVSYCHLSQVLVAKGVAVRPRDVVGITGSTGRSTGEHLHITCKLNGKRVDPLLVLQYIKTTQDECVAALVRL